MASLIDIFNPSFFIFLGILVLVAALLVVYFESKMREQNHKIASMLNLVTCMADEINTIKIIQSNQFEINNTLQSSHTNIPDLNELQTKILNLNSGLIHVSDDEESDSGSDSGSDSDSDSGSDSGSDSDSSLPKNNSTIIIDLNELHDLSEGNDIKVFKLSPDLPKDLIDFNESTDLLDDSNDLLDNLDDSNDLLDDSNDLLNDLDDLDKQDEEKIELNVSSLNLKSINMYDLEEVKPDNIDYKKMTINKLREIVVQKGIVQDSSKLKKPEILKLLGCLNE
jgi:hypothetical protein